MAAVAGEDVVPSRAREQHLDAVLPRESADEERIDGRRIAEGLVEVEDHPGEIVDHFRPDPDGVEVDAHVFRHALRVGKVGGHPFELRLLALEPDGEALEAFADEPALHALAAMLDVPLRIFDRETLAAEAPRLASPSAVVEEEIGIPGVAEAAALAAAGPDGKLIHKKVKSANATMALALAPAPVDEPALAGRKPGRVMLIGIGPGQAEWRTPEASQMILGADELVGYDLYIDLLGAVAAHIPRRDFRLGEEEARCRYALEAAAAGKDVAVICSGDAGIYAMGALVYELLDRDEADGGVSDAARRVQIVSAPGISALQAAAARSGAILGHDFCAISLSDLLTPWEAIEKRIHAAGVGDFVVAFYNPVSKRRRTQLAAAREILMQYRGGDVPVILASSLGRPDEKIQYRTLGGLDIDEVDMLTTVMVGASSSKRLDLGRGSAVYTPRGYAKHLDAPQGRKQDETEADT